MPGNVFTKNTLGNFLAFFLPLALPKTPLNDLNLY
jgi:hypothetical protein